MATPAAPLPDELVEEILLRLPPDDPASLVRAALVCKPWCRRVSGAGFRRRFHELHRTPPLLGLLCNFIADYELDEYIVRFVPPARFTPTQHVRRGWRAVDARHGRVLLYSVSWADCRLLPGTFVVWDPITGEQRPLPTVPRYSDCWNAAVLCAASPSGTCDHLNCHRGAFLVIVVTTEARGMFVHVYSSETGVWSERTVQRPDKPPHWLWPSALVGNALYFMLWMHTKILEYNLCTLETSTIDPPAISYKPQALTATEDGRLGFAAVYNSRLYLWSRDDGSDGLGHAGWTESRVIELNNLLPVNALLTSPTVVGFADGVGNIFVGTDVGVFTIDPKSQQVRNVYEGNVCNLLPYMSFYTPETTRTRSEAH